MGLHLRYRLTTAIRCSRAVSKKNVNNYKTLSLTIPHCEETQATRLEIARRCEPCHLARPRNGTTADQSCIGDRVVRSPEGARGPYRDEDGRQDGSPECLGASPIRVPRQPRMIDSL